MCVAKGTYVVRLEKEGEGGPAKEERKRDVHVRPTLLSLGRKRTGATARSGGIGGKEEGEGEPQPIRKLQFGDVKSRLGR